MKMKVCVSGCGGIAQVHARVLAENPDVTVNAFADPVRERALAMAERYGCRAYFSTEEMLDAEKPDAVHLCTPHYLHTEHAVYAAERGIAVFSEKPPAITAEQLLRLRGAAERVPLGVCFQNRFLPAVRFVREALENGTYGQLKGARAFVTWNRGKAYYDHDAWRGLWQTEGGGVLINQDIHTLDLLVWMLGKPDEVQASMANRHLTGVIETEDTAEIYMKKGDVPALLYFSNAAWDDLPVLSEYAFEKARLRVEESRVDIITPEGTESRFFPEDEKLGKSYWGAGHKMCIAHFYRSLLEGKQPSCALSSCLDTMETVIRIYDQCRDTLPGLK